MRGPLPALGWLGLGDTSSDHGGPNLVADHPPVAEVAVIGVPDERLGERVCACVVLRAGARLTLPELVAWLRDVRQVGIVKLPERLLELPAIPRNPNNKVIKAELRAAAARSSDASE